MQVSTQVHQKWRHSHTWAKREDEPLRSQGMREALPWKRLSPIHPASKNPLQIKLENKEIVNTWTFTPKSKDTEVDILSFFNHTITMCVLCHAQLFMTSWTAAQQTPLSMGFLRQEYWSHFLLQWIFLTQRSNWVSWTSRQILYHWATKEAHIIYTGEKLKTPFYTEYPMATHTDLIVFL